MSKSTFTAWLIIACLAAPVMLGAEETAEAIPQSTAEIIERILALRREYLNPGILTYYKEPLCIVEGHMQYLFDETGRQYLDAIAGIVTVSVGHCHPKITERVRAQIGRLVHTTTVYLHPTIVQYARELARRMPEG